MVDVGRKFPEYSGRTFLKVPDAGAATTFIVSQLPLLKSLRLESLLVPVEARPSSSVHNLVPTTCCMGKQD